MVLNLSRRDDEYRPFGGGFQPSLWISTLVSMSSQVYSEPLYLTQGIRPW